MHRGCLYPTSSAYTNSVRQATLHRENPSLSVPRGFKGEVRGSTVLNLMDVINNKSSYQAKGGICFPDGVHRKPQKWSRVGVPPKQTFKGLSDLKCCVAVNGLVSGFLTGLCWKLPHLVLPLPFLDCVIPCQKWDCVGIQRVSACKGLSAVPANNYL